MRRTLAAVAVCLCTAAIGRAKDNVPPMISGVAAIDINSTEATIVWTTNEPADSRVDYGLTTSLDLSVNNSVRVTSHSIRLTGLQPGGQYYYRVRSRDRSGNRSVSQTQTFVTADTAGPVISGVAATSITASGALIVWTTNEPADSEVRYGLTASYGSSRVDSNRVTSHSVSLSGLAAGTTYHYAVRSADASGNATMSGDFSFTTAATDTAPPVISGVAAGGITASGATITWTTDEAADSQVEYGTTTAYGSTTSLNPDKVTAHSVPLTALAADTQYHYRVRSADAAGNVTFSADQTFRTTAAGSSAPTYTSPFCDEGVPSSGYAWACGAWPAATPPALGAVNTTTTDADTGNRVLRVTAPGSHGQTSSASFFTNYGGWNHDWAADDSALIVRSWGGDGGKFWVGFDPATMKLTGASGRIPDTFSGDNFAFDETNPALIVGVQGLNVVSWNRNTGATTPIFTLTSVDSVQSITAKGKRICVADGPQDSGYLVECYNRESGAKQVIDVRAQTINGVRYTISYKGGTTTQPAAGIHAIALGADGRWLAFDLHNTPGCSADGLSNYSAVQGLVLDLDTSGAYSWSLACGQTHWAFGYDGAMVHGASPEWTSSGFNLGDSCPNDDDRGVVIRTAGATVDSSLRQAYCPSPAAYSISTHFTWQNNRDDANRNAYPLIGASLRNSSGNKFLFNDVFAVETTQPHKQGKIWRFAQTWNADKSANCDFLGWTSPVVARSGKYVAFPSNWMGQTGSGSCTNSKRVDVFVFELK